MPLTVAQLAEFLNAQLEGDADRMITGANTIEDATPTDLAFASSRKALESAHASQAGCLIVPQSFDASARCSLLRVAEPRIAFAKALSTLYPKKKAAAQIHPTAVIASTAEIDNSCSIGAHVTVGERTKIGANTFIGSSCCIGDDVAIGHDSTIHPDVTVYNNVSIGSNVILHAGCVIGADGFGFVLVNGSYQKFPQVGTVKIEDDVELGASCCVDRAALGVTRIGEGTKLDNLVHVAHNCNIGRHVVIAAQTGFSGSVTVGDYAVIGGQAGIGEKANIESKAIVGGKAGVLTSQTIHAGEPVWGIPARPLRRHLKGLAHVAKLDDYKKELKELRTKVAVLERAIGNQESKE